MMQQLGEPTKGALDSAWDSVVGGFDWVKSVLIGEFADNRPLSAIITDMLVSFLPGVVIVTSARDAVAVTLRLARHPEKREELMEWVVLCACLITIALPLAMAAGGAVFAGVGAIVGGIAGSELGAALRAVMLMLARGGTKLVELVLFLQKFIKGNILGFLKAVKFAQYEKALLQALSKISGKLIGMVSKTRLQLEKWIKTFEESGVVKWIGEHSDMLQNSAAVKEARLAIAKLTEWERRFYAVQQDALKHIPLALAELDARLAKILAESMPKEAHTVASGVQADRTVATAPAKQAVNDVAGRSLPKSADKPAAKGTSAATNSAKPARTKPAKAKGDPPPPRKDKPDPAKSADDAKNTKKQATADALAAAEKERITALSNEAAAAKKAGNDALAQAKIEEARNILRPYVPKHAGDSWDEVVKRLDVSSPKDGAVFWSGTASQAEKMGQSDAARVFAEKIGGVTLETTPGGRVIDGWDDVNKGLPWNADYGPPPWASDLWADASEKYANGATGQVNIVQTPDKLWDPRTIWHGQEKPLLLDAMDSGRVTGIDIHVVDLKGQSQVLSERYTESLLNFDQRK